MDWPALVFNRFAKAEYQKLNKHHNDANFDIQSQLEHFQYDMKRTYVKFSVLFVG